MSEQQQTPWLTIIGIGDDGIAGLSPAARLLVEASEQLVLGERLEALLDQVEIPKLKRLLNWSAGFRNTLDEILKLRGTPVTVIATGDPMHFGIGATLRRHVAPQEMRIWPAPSAFSLAAARLGWPLQQVAQISLHGRPVALLARHLLPGARILALTSDAATAQEAAALMVAAGFGRSALVLLSHMGGAREARHDTTAAGLLAEPPDPGDFYVLAIDCLSDGAFYPPLAGLPDEAFRHDGQLTKREVRAVTLSLLSPFPNALLWDVGAGCGSVAIEWLRAGMGTHAVAIEADAARLSMIGENAARLGVPDLEIEAGEAPDALGSLPAPDAVFIGGGLSRAGLFEACWSALPVGGRLVANAVTVEGEAILAGLRGAHGGNLRRIAVSRAAPVGRYCGWKSLMPVTIWDVEKGRAP